MIEPAAPRPFASDCQTAPDAAEGEAFRLRELERYEIMDTDPEENFDRLVKLAAFICATPTSLMSLLDERREWFKAKIGSDADEAPRSIAFCAHAIATEADIMVVEDATLDARFADNPMVTGAPFIRFYAGAPMRNKAGARLGAICVIDSNPGKLTAAQRSLLTDLAAIAVDEMELRVKIRQLIATSQIDEMTGAHNRAYFLERAEAEQGRALRYRRPLGLLFFDLDHFKRVNDTWGHAAGDATLSSVVRVAKSTLRSQDVLARMGGEEFAALLPETDLEGAARIAERLRIGVEKMVLVHDGARITVTISIGVALVDSEAEIAESLERADKALYRAKHEGRNAVVVAD